MVVGEKVGACRGHARMRRGYVNRQAIGLGGPLPSEGVDPLHLDHTQIRHQSPT